MLNTKELEELADHLLSLDLKNTKRNKTRTEEYPILSESQLKRRAAMEYPISSLGKKQLLNAQLAGMDIRDGLDDG